jgi:poly(3-hydroxybutyrate) depolymerase
VVERMQLALDAAATAVSRYHVDPLRIYATGMSGGGRVSSMLWGTFPEVFRGAVPIVGINTYQNIPAGGGRAWRAGFSKPTGERWAMLRGHRLAAITGSRDGNQAHTLAAISLMKADGLAVKEYDYPDLAHEYPSPERFLAALRWVDEPARDRRASESAAAAALLETFKKSDTGRLDPRARRRALVEVTAAGPWSDAAWEAAELLGLVGEAAPPP